MSEMLNLDELTRIAGVLMGAAYADGELDGNESSTVYTIMGQLLGERAIPDNILQYLESFNPELFDLKSVCSGLNLVTTEDRQALLALVGEIVEADDLHSHEEDDYIVRVAEAIGAPKEEYAELTMNMVEIASHIVPPPIPEDA